MYEKDNPNTTHTISGLRNTMSRMASIHTGKRPFGKCNVEAPNRYAIKHSSDDGKFALLTALLGIRVVAK
jgi:hypothetical protein